MAAFRKPLFTGAKTQGPQGRELSTWWGSEHGWAGLLGTQTLFFCRKQGTLWTWHLPQFLGGGPSFCLRLPQCRTHPLPELQLVATQLTHQYQSSPTAAHSIHTHTQPCTQAHTPEHIQVHVCTRTHTMHLHSIQAH